MLNRNIKPVLITIFAGALLATYTHAESSTATQRITITIPPVRAIYLNHENQIIAAFSNIAHIEETKLQVFKAGCEINADDDILKKYRNLLPQIDWNQVGWVYMKSNPDNSQDKESTPEAKSSANQKNCNKSPLVVFVPKTFWV